MLILQSDYKWVVAHIPEAVMIHLNGGKQATDTHTHTHTRTHTQKDTLRQSVLDTLPLTRSPNTHTHTHTLKPTQGYTYQST